MSAAWKKGDVAWLASEYGAPKKVTLRTGGASQPLVGTSKYDSRRVDVSALFEAEEEAVKASARMMVERLQSGQRRRVINIDLCERQIEQLRRDIEAAKPDIAAAIARARELGVVFVEGAVFASTGGSQEAVVAESATTEATP